MMKFSSLFAGIGGFDLGFHQAGMRSVAQVEIDPTCRTVLARHFPDARRHDDVTTADSATIGAIDLLCGGFPCQDLSVAGRRAGLAGKRSGLFYEFMRLVADVQPRWVVIENVPGLLSSRGGRDMGAVLGTLGELGYGWAYRSLDAQYFGVAQRRERVFIVGCLGDAARAAQVLFEPTSCGGDSPPRRETGQGATRSFAFGAHAGSDGDKSHVGHAKGGPTAFGLHEEVVPTLRSQRTQAIAGAPDIAHSLRAQGQLAHREDVDTLIAFSSKDYGNDATTDLAPTMRSVNFDQSHINGGGQIAIAFTQNTRDEVRYINGDGALAGALGAQEGMKQRTYVAQTAYGISGQLNAAEEVVNNLQVPSSTGGGHPAMVGSAMAVRRLTPTECSRLQGFPDDWNAYGADGKPLSDSVRYRQLGNAVCVPVAAWIGKRIMEVA